MKATNRALPLCLVLLAVAGTLSAQSTQYVDREMAGDPDVYRVFTLVEPSDVELYRELLPDEFGMPEQPMLMVMVANYRSYQEASIMMRCITSDGEPAQYVVTMPLTHVRPLIIGLEWGLPKYLADMKVDRHGGWVYQDGKVKLGLEFTPTTSRLSALEQEYLSMRGADLTPNRGLLMMPPTDDGSTAVLRIGGPREVELPSREWGMVKIIIDSNDPWAGLIDPGTEVMGLLQMRGAPMDDSGGGGGLFLQDWKNGAWVTRTDEEFRREVDEANAEAEALKAAATRGR